MRSPLVSVIVTTKNEEDVLGRLLKSVKKQSYKNIEIIVVDNFSSDNTPEIAKTFTKKVYQKGPERSAQRNFGANKARGEYLLFLDADMEFTPGVVEECVDVISQGSKMAAAAILEESIASSFWEKVKAFERSFYNLEGDELTAAARFFKKDLLFKMGGYDEKITGPEDWDLTERLKKRGYKIGIVSSRILHYERIPSILPLLKKKYYYGLKSHRYLQKQKIGITSPKTIYFLRPVFYKNWKRLISNPILSLAMFLMFTLEMFAGGLGYVIGRFKKG